MLGAQPRRAPGRRPDLRAPEPRRDVRRAAARSTALPHRLHPVRRRGPASLDAPADRPASRRRHLARARSAWSASRPPWSPGPLLVTIGPDADGGLAVIAAGTALLSLLVLARLYGLVGLLARDVGQAPRARGPAQLPGLPRPADRAWPTGAGSSTRPRPRSAARSRHRHDRRPVPRPRRLQDRQRQPRARGRRRAAGGGRRADPRPASAPTDVAARLGGDEFGVLLLDIPMTRLRHGRRRAAARRRSRRPLESRASRSRSAPASASPIDTPAMHGVDDLLERRRRRDVPGQGARQGPPPRLRRQPRGPRSPPSARGPSRPRTVRRPAIGAAAPRAGRRLGPGPAD